MAQHSHSPLLPEAEAMWGPFTLRGGINTQPTFQTAVEASLLGSGASKGPAVNTGTSVKRLGILLLTSDHHPHRQGAPH